MSAMELVFTIISFLITRLIHSGSKMTTTEDCLWSFGYGSNMDVKALEAKKHVKILGKNLHPYVCVGTLSVSENALSGPRHAEKLRDGETVKDLVSAFKDNFVIPILANLSIAVQRVIGNKCSLFCPSVRPSICLSIRPSVRLSICPSVHLSVSTRPSVDLSVNPCVYPSVCPYLSICVSIRPSLSVRMYISRSAFPSLYLSVRLSVYLPISLCTCLTLISLSSYQIGVRGICP
jgi:hypothetical protein